ncbi:MAG: co-chaperone DjlA [Pseudomonadota bacterium]|nr:co-chaperone DjlA [Pseudomonadota bacterium]
MIGKIIGAYFGYALTAPSGYSFLGILLGIWIGSKFDNSISPPHLNTSYFFSYSHSETQRTFFDAAFAVMGYIAKFDGVVSEQEIAVAEEFMGQLNLNSMARREAIAAFNRGKSPGFDLDMELDNLIRSCRGQIVLLKIFIDVQNRAASVDGLSSNKAGLINHICERLGFSAIYNSYNSHSNTNRVYKFSKEHELSQAYKTLEIQQDCSNQDLKRAYRKLIGKNHPDRLISQGLPQEMLKVANQKTAEIKKAYELIKTSRGI